MKNGVYTRGFRRNIPYRFEYCPWYHKYLNIWRSLFTYYFFNRTDQQLAQNDRSLCSRFEKHFQSFEFSILMRILLRHCLQIFPPFYVTFGQNVFSKLNFFKKPHLITFLTDQNDNKCSQSGDMALEFDLKKSENFVGSAQVFRTSYSRYHPWSVISICSSTCAIKGTWI